MTGKNRGFWRTAAVILGMALIAGTAKSSAGGDRPATPRWIDARVEQRSIGGQAGFAVILKWEHDNPQDSISVFRSSTSGSGYEIRLTVSGTTYQDTQVELGKTYYYILQARDRNFSASAFSEEKAVAVVVQAEPPQRVAASPAVYRNACRDFVIQTQAATPTAYSPEDRLLGGGVFEVGSPAGGKKALALVFTRIEAAVDGPAARVTVAQRFRNDGPDAAGGRYLFPLPRRAALTDFLITRRASCLGGAVMAPDAAEKTAREATAPGALILRENQTTTHLFQRRIDAMEPGEEVAIEFVFSTPIEENDGWRTLTLPLVLGYRNDGSWQPRRGLRDSPVSYRPGLRARKDVEVTVRLPGPRPSLEIESPSHAIVVEEAPGAVLVRLKETLTMPNKDFALRYRIKM